MTGCRQKHPPRLPSAHWNRDLQAQCGASRCRALLLPADFGMLQSVAERSCACGSQKQLWHQGKTYHRFPIAMSCRNFRGIKLQDANTSLLAQPVRNARASPQEASRRTVLASFLSAETSDSSGEKVLHLGLMAICEWNKWPWEVVLQRELRRKPSAYRSPVTPRRRVPMTRRRMPHRRRKARSSMAV